MKPLEALAERWRENAQTLAHYGDSRGADICRTHAAELEEAVGAMDDELLAPAEAAEYAGVTERTIRQWKADGRLRNHGTEGRPMYRRGELPKAGTAPPDIGAYDAAADAARLAA